MKMVIKKKSKTKLFAYFEYIFERTIFPSHGWRGHLPCLIHPLFRFIVVFSY